MARLIDANELIENAQWFEEYIEGQEVAFKYIDLEDVENAATVDAVEVVRCKNCQCWNPRYETMGMCMKHNSIVTFTKPDFYCALGKGKNDGICKED